MFLIYLTVIIVVLVMVLFVILLIAKLVRIMGSQIRRNAMRQLGRYSNLIDQKSKQLNEIEGKLKEVSSCKVIPISKGTEQPSEPKTFPTIPANANELSENLPSQYRQIRKLYINDPHVYMKEVASYEAPKQAEYYKKQTDFVLKKLDYETIYKLTLLERKEQLLKVKELCGGEDVYPLSTFLESLYDKRFDLQEFLFYLKDKSKRYDHTMYVEVSDQSLEEEEENITVVKELLEGMTIKRYGMFYDYGLSRREIGL